MAKNLVIADKDLIYIYDLDACLDVDSKAKELEGVKRLTLGWEITQGVVSINPIPLRAENMDSR